jgi:endonuclease III
MVEGLLAQTRADAVAEHYEGIFNGVRRYADWLAISQPERVGRVRPLGLPRLKEAAVTSIAAALLEPIDNAEFNDALFAATLRSLHGIGPYTAAMLTVIFGGDAVPMDCNVDRVGSRVAEDGDAERWMADIIEGVRTQIPETGYHPFYEVTCAVLDLGATLCGARNRRCGWCPLLTACSFAQHSAYQGNLFGGPENKGDTQRL